MKSRYEGITNPNSIQGMRVYANRGLITPLLQLQRRAYEIALPFPGDDLFLKCADARAGFEVLAEIARSTRFLFFAHEHHLVTIANLVVGNYLQSEWTLQ